MPQGLEIVLFDATDAGPYGDGSLNPRRQGSYERTIHGLVDAGGFAPMFEGTEVNVGFAQFASDVPFAIEWVNSSGHPIVMFLYRLDPGAADVAMRIDPTGVGATDRTFTGKEFGAIPAALHSNGGSTPYLFVCFNASGDIEYRNVAGSWAADGAFAGTPAQADGLLSENGNLWAGLTNGYQVRKWPAGVNPRTGTAGAAIDIGNSALRITGAGLLARSYVVFVKPDGIYIYDIDTNRFENVWQDIPVHPDTGKGTRTWNGDVFVPLGWGGMVRISQTTLRPEPASPLPRVALPGPDTPGRQRVLAMASDAQYLYATIEPFARRNLSIISNVFTTTDDAVFNDRTAVVTDDDPNTTFTLADLSPGSGRIFVGCSERFGGAHFTILGAAISSGLTGDYWNGSAWTSLGTLKDYTGVFSYSGAVFPVTRVPSDWAVTTVSTGAGLYYLRFTLAGVETTTAVREVRVLPDPIPLSGQSAISGRARANMATDILRGYVAGEEMVWDTYITHDLDFARQLLFTQVKAAGSGRILMAFGPADYARFQVGISGRPQQESFPDCTNAFSSELALSADDRLSQYERAPTVVKGIEYVDIYGKNWSRGNDPFDVYVSWDGATPQLLSDNVTSVPVRVQVPLHDSGRGAEYAITVAAQDTSRGERVPQITKVVASVYPVRDLLPEDA